MLKICELGDAKLLSGPSSKWIEWQAALKRGGPGTNKALERRHYRPEIKLDFLNYILDFR